MTGLKRIMTLACALTLTVSSALAAGSSFGDVTGDEWYAAAAEELCEKGIITGVEGGLFAPDRPVTRATVVTVLWRLEGSPEATVSDPFPDVEAWYATAAAWAKGKGIAVGDETGAFRGSEPVTREQLAVFFSRYAAYRQEPLAQGLLGIYADAGEVSSWAREAMGHAVGAGLLQGDEAGRLDPKGTASRAALAVVLQRLLTPAAG